MGFINISRDDEDDEEEEPSLHPNRIHIGLV